jgi:hypothetical protein
MLFKTIQEIKEYTTVGNITMPSATPVMNVAEEDYVLPLLGTELYNLLSNSYSNNSIANMPANLKALLPYARKVAAPYFAAAYYNKSDVSLSDSGGQRIETSNNKTAYQYQGTNFKEANIREGEKAAEKLLVFLAKNESDYEQWALSSAAADYKSFFIKNGSDFASLFTSASPHRNYIAMRPKMADMELMYVEDVMGTELTATLKEKLHSNTLLPAEKKVVDCIKKIIAYYTVAFSLPFLNVRIDAEGLSVVALTSFGSNDKSNSRGGITTEDIERLQNSCTESGRQWVERLHKLRIEYATELGIETALIVKEKTNFQTIFAII